ncbi:oxidoreductase,short chain dehydrogenase, putative [Coccidioides posadasii C735 delta SOWgp]|uniref:Oxidoreductase,short chain dehydrogenase, putative n=1 Tax=Coccidioides posadasii (strain C735) TaxID=222929 RepID=C5P5W4_COCP7|nr:oxidoreductase,short chain dehydrogenase, putative [Coccidioides posadasii C735 delta SOWgp]EER28104.1 oxidoreductase,short chain dehydrogenase, putative [Coccidioides posadasii C735 delta SOWgp]|eukprot:XP_003070249.1 oxidoreductase,short chain dehydrogenase, putative [Coccidioides posadasii C735 delta SOWgp]
MQGTLNRPLEGKFGIVTGGSRGNSTARIHDLCEGLKATCGIQCFAQQADLGNPVEAVEKILFAARQHFVALQGSSHLQIDILINNAGISENRFLNDPERGPIDVDTFNKQYNVNVLAPLLLTQAIAPYLPRNRSGRIVNLSSISTSLGLAGQSVYAGTKGALEAMTRTWARELGDRATVNAVNPGPVLGDMYWAAGEGFWKRMQGWQDNTPGSNMIVEPGFTGTGEERLSEEDLETVREKMGGRRPAFTDEIAGVVGMLCTKDAAWCTGSVICANGGLRMSI